MNSLGEDMNAPNFYSIYQNISARLPAGIYLADYGFTTNSADSHLELTNEKIYKISTIIKSFFTNSRIKISSYWCKHRMEEIKDQIINDGEHNYICNGLFIAGAMHLGYSPNITYTGKRLSPNALFSIKLKYKLLKNTNGTFNHIRSIQENPI
jgi:hypothetical protein